MVSGATSAADWIPLPRGQAMTSSPTPPIRVPNPDVAVLVNAMAPKKMSSWRKPVA